MPFHTDEQLKMAQCLICDLTKQRDEGNAPLWDNIHRTTHWDIAHCNSTSLLGWLVLVIRRHIAAVDEMTDEESVELGRLIRQVSWVLKAELGCTKTYVVQFAESPGNQHVHFHIIPRMADTPEDSIGANIFKHLGVAAEARVQESTMNQLALRIRRKLLEK